MMGLQLLMTSVNDAAFDDTAFDAAAFDNAASDDMAFDYVASAGAAFGKDILDSG